MYLRKINGDTVDIKVLLSSLDIHESSDDIFDLLWFVSRGHPNNFENKLHTIGIERALFICDELCAPTVVTKILNIGHRLNRIYECAIINHKYDPNYIVRAYNNGYRPISHDTSYVIHDTALFNIACSNGLYISNFTLHTNDINTIHSDYSKDITDIHIYSSRSNSNSNKITHLTNVNKLKITQESPYNSNIRDTYEQLAKQLTCINITNSNNIINNMHLELCTNLKELYMNSNRYITKCTQQIARSLRSIYVAFNGSMHDNGLLLCTNLKILNASNNRYIRTCTPFAHSLVMLDATDHCGISDDGLKLCTRLKILCSDNNKKITTCSPFAKTLRILDASYSCGIGDNGLKLCTKLTYLNASHNNKITTCAPFTNSLKIIRGYECNIPDSDLKKCVKLSYVVGDKFKDIPAYLTTQYAMYDTLRIVKFMNTCKI